MPRKPFKPWRVRHGLSGRGSEEESKIPVVKLRKLVNNDKDVAIHAKKFTHAYIVLRGAAQRFPVISAKQLKSQVSGTFAVKQKYFLDVYNVHPINGPKLIARAHLPGDGPGKV